MPENLAFEAEEIVPQTWFSTPIWAYQLTDYSRINQDILSVLQVLESETHSDPVIRSNIGGWHSESDMHRRDDLAEITHAIAVGCAGCARHLGFDFKNYDLFIVDMWLNHNRPGNMNKIHIHPHSMLSGVYYVQAPPGCGNIEFLDPVIARTATQFPKAQRSQNNASTAEFEAVEGMLMVFPSWLQHWVQPNRGTGERVSISFNVGYRPKGKSAAS